MTSEELEYQQRIALAIHKRFMEKGEPESAQDEIFLLSSMGNKWAHEQSAQLRSEIVARMRQKTNKRLYDALRDTLKFDSTVSFDAFMRFMEWERDPAKKFYAP